MQQSIITKRLVCEGLASSTKNEGNIFPKILRVGIVETADPDILSVSLEDICVREVLKAKDNTMKKNNMTTVYIK